MRVLARVGGLIVAAMLSAGHASAQVVRDPVDLPQVSFTAMGLFAWHPPHQTYFPPYLYEPLGGMAPGLSVGTTILTPGRLVVTAEFATSFLTMQQGGRIVGAARDSATSTLHDALLTGLVGYSAWSPTIPARRFQFLAGISTVLSTPSVNGKPRFRDDVPRLAPTVGFDLVHTIHRRAAVAVGVRYSYLRRGEGQQDLGVGSHVLRVGAGVRVPLR